MPYIYNIIITQKQKDMKTIDAINLASQHGIAFSKGRDFKGYEYWTNESIKAGQRPTEFHGTWSEFTKWLKAL
jgi:hypothetical protein